MNYQKNEKPSKLRVDLNNQRKKSYKRLLSGAGRSAEKESIHEKIINRNPIHLSFAYCALLKLSGVKVGRNVKFRGKLNVKLRGKPSNIIIGNDVVFGKNVDLRNRENGKIILSDRVYLDDGVRIIAARDGKVEIGVGSELGSNTIINSGGITEIGEFCMIAGNVQMHAQNHETSKDKYIKDQLYEYGRITIGSDVWIGSFSTILVNSVIGEGAVVGANSMTNGKIPDFAISVGCPAKVIRHRE